MEKTGQRAAERLIRMKELKTIIGISSTSIWRRCNEGIFPAPVRIGPGAVAWRLSEVESWVDTRQVVEKSVPPISKRGRKPRRSI